MEVERNGEEKACGENNTTVNVKPSIMDVSHSTYFLIRVQMILRASVVTLQPVRGQCGQYVCSVGALPPPHHPPRGNSHHLGTAPLPFRNIRGSPKRQKRIRITPNIPSPTKKRKKYDWEYDFSHGNTARQHG